MKINLTKPKQRMILLVGVFGVLGAFVYFRLLLIPRIGQASMLGKEIRAAQDQLRSLDQVLVNEDRVREQHARMLEVVASRRAHLPSEDELPSMIQRLSDLATRAQVKIQTIFPQISFTEEDLVELLAEGGAVQLPYRTIPIQIDGLGGYHEIGTFLSLVETESTPMEIESFQILANPKEFRRHNMRLVLNVFFAAGEADGEGTANPQGGT